MIRQPRVWVENWKYAQALLYVTPSAFISCRSETRRRIFPIKKKVEDKVALLSLKASLEPRLLENYKTSYVVKNLAI